MPDSMVFLMWLLAESEPFARRRPFCSSPLNSFLYLRGSCRKPRDGWV